MNATSNAGRPALYGDTSVHRPPTRPTARPPGLARHRPRECAIGIGIAPCPTHVNPSPSLQVDLEYEEEGQGQGSRPLLRRWFFWKVVLSALLTAGLATAGVFMATLSAEQVSGLQHAVQRCARSGKRL